MKNQVRMLGGLTSAALLAPAMLIAPAAEALPPVMISQIVYDSFGATKDDYSNRSLNAEYVVLKNTTSRTQTVTGWTLRDKTGFTYRLPATTIPAKGSIRIFTGKGTNTNAKGSTTPGKRYWGKTSYVWNNTGDTATLRNKAGKSMDSCTYRDKSTKDNIKSVAC
ncbi:lamin tail domain-containing protein [Kytococcus sedentarius]|uniref:lamin tail domain-containing protein n=1 Tax=Kytococcus sedentarius TaxID=1276 RepID=UPI0035BC090C